MNFFIFPAQNHDEILADIKRRMANNQTVTDDDLHKILKSETPQAVMSKWEFESNDLTRRRIGKTSEECAELLSVLARIAIQGIDATDPASGKSNRQRMMEEMADVYAQLDESRQMLNLDTTFIQKRRYEKRRQMKEWESLYWSDEG